jgi:hypothetical protein
VISAGLTQLAFRAQPIFENSGTQQTGKPPWVHYRVDGDVTDGKHFHVTLCFYNQTLVSVDLSADLYPPTRTGSKPLPRTFTTTCSNTCFRGMPARKASARPRTVRSYHDPRSSANSVVWQSPRRSTGGDSRYTYACGHKKRICSKSNPEYAWGFEAAKMELVGCRRQIVSMSPPLQSGLSFRMIARN